MSMWKKTMTWLGLDPDLEYEVGSEGEAFNDPALRPAAPDVTPVPARRSGTAVEASPTDFSAVRSLGPIATDDYSGDVVPGDPSPRLSNASLRPVEVPSRDEPTVGTVQPVPATPSSKPQLVAPRSFNDAQEIGDRFRGGAPVILNLQETDSELGRRLIDFCSGLCYGLRGSMQRVGDRVFLLTPAEVQLTPDDHRLIRDSGLIG